MFNFLKRSENKVLKKFEILEHDIHSHVLPGLDDGSPDIATSIQLVKGLYDLGLRNLIATPHIIGDFYRNSPETIRPALQLLQTELERQGIDMKITAAAEYMLDDYFMSLIHNKVELLPIHDNIILTEFSYALAPTNIKEMIFNIFTAGYQPILAHPERYFYYHRNLNEYVQLKELGFLFQVNLLSFTGYYGIRVQKVARFLIEKGLVDLVGTDMHHIRHLETIKTNLNIIEEAIGKKKYNTFL